MLCNIKPVPFHESDKHIFAKIPEGVWTPGPPPLDPPMYLSLKQCKKFLHYIPFGFVTFTGAANELMG